MKITIGDRELPFPEDLNYRELRIARTSVGLTPEQWQQASLGEMTLGFVAVALYRVGELRETKGFVPDDEVERLLEMKIGTIEVDLTDGADEEDDGGPPAESAADASAPDGAKPAAKSRRSS